MSVLISRPQIWIFRTTVLLLSFSVLPAQADQLLGDWQRGDLIFQETTGPEAEMLKSATSRRYTHVGILRASGGGPIVVEATQNEDVYETDLGAFLERGVDGNYAIYRIKGLKPPEDWYHPLVLAATDFFNLPYDVHYRADTTAIYGSELIFLSAQAIGIDLGSPQKIGSLSVENESSRSFFLKSWKNVPECKSNLTTIEECWDLIKEQLVITPAQIAASDRLELVTSTFEEPQKD